MKHFGDITKINGYEVPAVDIITGGSPCQDLSVAGKRAGLAGERSGLFMEQIRIIKEMRNGTSNDNRRMDSPRFMVWENVPGAFSSNNGEDFRAVLEETAKIIDENAVIPRPADGKWTNAGCIVGNGWSIAWRVHDAQFWGVPQRRKRIALVADFRGYAAPEILFERKSVFGGFAEGGKQGENTSANITKCPENTGGTISFQERAGKPGGGKGILIQNERTGALSTLNNQSVVYGLDRAAYNQGKNAKFNISIEEEKIGAQVAKGPGAVCCPVNNDSYQKVTGALCLNDYKGANRTYVDTNKLIEQGSVVRRLTPMECERLQGFPDEWTNIGDWIDSQGMKHKGDSDAPRYKALGNSIALPFWEWMAVRMIGHLGKYRPTMASLFDGIGGFPLAFSRAGCKPVWASEIEEFPMAVTKQRFGID